MFKKGDVVVCVLPNAHPENRVTNGKEYTVTEDSNRELTRVICDNGKEIPFYNNRFVLKGQALALPKKAKAVKPIRKEREFIVGDSIRIVSNNSQNGFHNDPKYDNYIGKLAIVTQVLGGSDYQRVYCKALSAGYLDSRQCKLDLRKDGKPRVLRKPAVRKTNVASLIKTLDESCKGIGYNCCSYIHTTAYGHVQKRVAAACYADLNYAEWMRAGAGALVVNLSSHYEAHSNKKGYIRWCEYILHRSVFKGAFKNVGKEPWLTSLELDITKSSSYLVTCAIALREGHEHSTNMEMWLALVDKGYSEDVAWFVSGFMRKDGNKYSPWRARSHTIRYDEMSYDNVLAMLLQPLVDPTPTVPFSMVGRNEYKIFTTVDRECKKPGGKGDIYKRLTANLKTTVVGDGWDKKETTTFESICEAADMVAKDLAALKAPKVDHQPAAAKELEAA